MTADGAPQADTAQPSISAITAVLGGLRVVAEGRHSALRIAPGEYLADIYCIQRVATLLAMELAAAGRSLRQQETAEAERAVHQIESLLHDAMLRLGVAPDGCVLDCAEARVIRRDGHGL